MACKEERLRAALARIAWAADAGRQFNPGTEQVMRDLFKDIRDMARRAIIDNHIPFPSAED